MPSQVKTLLCAGFIKKRRLNAWIEFKTPACCIYSQSMNQFCLSEHVRNEAWQTSNRSELKRFSVTAGDLKRKCVLMRIQRCVSPLSPSGRRRSLNSEEMAVFYKSFLDRNRIRHANYNKWVVFQLGVSHGAAGWLGTSASTGAVGLNLHWCILYLVYKYNKHGRLSRAFSELALQSGWLVFQLVNPP